MIRPFLMSCAAIAVLAACNPNVEDGGSPEAMPAEQAVSVEVRSADVQKSDAGYILDWSLSQPGAPVRIEVSDNPDAAPGAGLLIGDGVTETNFTWVPEATPSERQYFIISAGDTDPVTTALRVLPLEGGRNFRDLGGYETEDGRTVRWGRIYRSGVMSGLTSADYDYLSGLGIKVICDFRTAGERTSEPTDWQAGPIDYLTFPDPEAADQASFMTVFRQPDVTPEQVSQAMAEGYSQIARDQVPAYREMFDRLAAGEIPLAFNCSAGKDRTGIGAALILTALGVPRDTVLADYALSEKVVDYMADMHDNASEDAAEDNPYAFLAQLPPELVAPLMRSDPLYLETAFADIEAEYGSVRAFLREEVDVTDEEVEAIRSELLVQ